MDATALRRWLREALARRGEAPPPLPTAVAALGLWLLALFCFSVPDHRAEGFRMDVNEVVAYPRSDAAMDYLNATAILSGDGWVNWRDINRWSVYRPGWGAFLAGLAAVTGHDLAAMQRILTMLLALTGPLFLLLVLELFPGPRDLLLAVVATTALLLNPFVSWWYQRTMMSEGPTLLLLLLLSLLAVRFCGRRGVWSWRQGFVLGLVAAALCLVRGQSRTAVVALFVLLVAASARHWRRRLPFLVAMVVGLVALLGPLYLKTSIHLRMPYTGTSYFALVTMLKYTEAGRAAGGHRLPAGELSEREATKLLQGRLRDSLAIAAPSLPSALRDGFYHYTRYIHGASAKAVGRPAVTHAGEPRPVNLVVFWLLTAVGIYFAWRRAGPAALAPLVVAAGYILPMVPFWFYRSRFGAPISWVGLAYLAGVLLVFRGGGAGREPAAVAAGREPDAGWPGRRFFLVVGAWLVISTSALLWFDLAPLPKVDAERLLASDGARQTLARAGVEIEPGLVEEADRLLNGGGDGVGERLLTGVAVFPLTIEPDDDPVPLPFDRRKLPPRAEPYGVFHLVSPWKRGDSLRVSQVRIRGRAAEGLRGGEQVLVVRTPGSVETVSNNRVVIVRADAVVSIR